MGEALSPAAGGMSRMTGDMSPESAPTPRMTGDMPLFAESLPLFKRDKGFHRPQQGFPSPAMPLWNNATWNAPGTFWGPAQPPVPETQTRQRTRNTMKRQRYYPSIIAEQGAWNGNFADKLAQYIAFLALSPTAAAAISADARYLQYTLNQWLQDVRTFSQASTQALAQLESGTGSAPYALPTFSAPALPPGDATATPPIPATVPVAPGALNRIFDFVQMIKRSPGYTDAIGQDLGIVGSEDTTVHNAPDYNLVTEMGTGCQCVKVRFKKYGHYAVSIYSKRGGTDWELLGIDSASPYEDDRPLLVAGQPEIREYRLRFWDAGSENGEWSSILSVTVSV